LKIPRYQGLLSTGCGKKVRCWGRRLEGDESLENQIIDKWLKREARS